MEFFQCVKLLEQLEQSGLDLDALRLLQDNEHLRDQVMKAVRDKQKKIKNGVLFLNTPHEITVDYNQSPEEMCHDAKLSPGWFDFSKCRVDSARGQQKFKVCAHELVEEVHLTEAAHYLKSHSLMPASLEHLLAFKKICPQFGHPGLIAAVGTSFDRGYGYPSYPFFRFFDDEEELDTTGRLAVSVYWHVGNRILAIC